MGWDDGVRAQGWWALTGTPGTGKSAVARALAPGALGIELADLAEGFGARRLAGRTVEIDLGALARFVRAHAPAYPVLVAGHLSHRLPIPRVIVLRCHPRELARRLARRGTPPSETRANVACEAIDLLAAEARGLGRSVTELDTTGRRPAEVAREIRTRLGTRADAGSVVDWLTDPDVPELLLAPER